MAVVAVFSTKVKSVYPRFTMAEKKVADYLILNREEIGDVSSHELAERLGVGQSTVMRFSKKMGYAMFGELIADVRDSQGDSSTEIDESDSTFSVLSKVEEKYKAVLSSIMRSNRAEDFDRAARLLGEARSIVCFGYTNSHILAEYLSESLVELGKNAVCNVDLIQTKRRLQLLDPRHDLVVVVSKSGDKAEPVGVAQLASERGISVIALCDASDNPLARLATVHLKVMEISDRSTPMASMGTDAGVLAVADVLVSCLFQSDRRRYARSYANSLIAAFSERR